MKRKLLFFIIVRYIHSIWRIWCNARHQTDTQIHCHNGLACNRFAQMNHAIDRHTQSTRISEDEKNEMWNFPLFLGSANCFAISRSFLISESIGQPSNRSTFRLEIQRWGIALLWIIETLSVTFVFICNEKMMRNGLALLLKSESNSLTNDMAFAMHRNTYSIFNRLRRILSFHHYSNS